MAELTDRDRHIGDFIDRIGWGDAARQLVAGDASNRRYERLTRPDGALAILMDAPPAKGEDVRPFVRIAQFLTDNGFSAPRILEHDFEQGFLLIEDLGDQLFARLLEREPDRELALYEAACDVLIRLADTPPPPLEPYDATAMTDLAALAYDWYAAHATGHDIASDRQRFTDAFHALLSPLDADPQVLVQRDYHAENLLWLPDRQGVARVGLLDFQDARLGHRAYDLVSYLQDARRDVSAATDKAIKARFRDALGLDPAAFDSAYARLGLQRNLRILGVFARLCLRDGKAHYVDLIPRVWGHIQTNLAHPDLAGMRAHLDATLPPPDPEVLTRLKAACATHPKP